MIDSVLLSFNEFFSLSHCLSNMFFKLLLKSHKTFVLSDCSLIQCSKLLAMLKLLEITIPGETSSTWKADCSLSCPFCPVCLTSNVLQW